jgi:hypothetical protein
MGMAFPIGMAQASSRAPSLTPWLWGINGATSVCGSVLAVIIALHSGLAASFWTGFGCYVVAFAAYTWAAGAARLHALLGLKRPAAAKVETPASGPW